MVQEGAQARVVVFAKAGICAKRIRYLSQRLAEMFLQHLFVRNVVRYFAQTVHVVGEGDQAGLNFVIAQNTKGMPHHRRAGNFTEGAYVRKAGWTVTGFKDDFVLGVLLEPRDNLARLFKWPSIRLFRDLTQRRSGRSNRHHGLRGGGQ